MGEMGEMGSVYEQYYTGERVRICAELGRALINLLSFFYILCNLMLKNSTRRKLNDDLKIKNDIV